MKEGKKVGRKREEIGLISPVSRRNQPGKLFGGRGAVGLVGLLLFLHLLGGVRRVLRERERNGAESDAEAEREYHEFFHIVVILLCRF